MDLVFATQAKGSEAGAELQSELLVLLVGQVGVSRELEELPLLVNLLNLAIDVLLDLLELLVHLDELSATDGMVVGKSGGAAPDDIVDGLDILVRSVDETILGLGMATRDGLTGNLFKASGLDCERWFVNHAQRHDASLVSHCE